MTDKSAPSASGTQSVERAVALLKALAKSAPARGASLSELAAQVGLNKATARRLLVALEQGGLASQEASGRRYKLGLDLVGLGLVASEHVDIIGTCQGALARLAAELGDTAYLMGRIGNEAICLASHAGAFPIQITMQEVGFRWPLTRSGGGMAILAELAEEEMRGIMAEVVERAEFIAHKIDINDIIAMIVEARANGYYYHDGRYLRGICDLAVSIVDPMSRPVAALSVVAIEARFEGERFPTVLRALLREKRAIEAQIALK